MIYNALAMRETWSPAARREFDTAGHHDEINRLVRIGTEFGMFKGYTEVDQALFRSVLALRRAEIRAASHGRTAAQIEVVERELDTVKMLMQDASNAEGVMADVDILLRSDQGQKPDELESTEATFRLVDRLNHG